jgi:hypothetical protein
MMMMMMMMMMWVFGTTYTRPLKTKTLLASTD